jgi:16S rRNA pseudouridine516 synthase
MRLDRLLANSGYGSRTTVKELIRSRKVCINGTVITDSSFHVDTSPQPDISISGKNIRTTLFLHYMMNKPSGCITALDDRKHQTVAEFIPDNLLTAGIFPVGRLDIDTTGLLILTNNGTLCHRLTGPSWHIPKTYYLEAGGKYFDETDVKILAEGIRLGPNTVCRPAELRILTSSSGLLTITEGKYHQVKKMILALGGKVTKLERRSMGPLALPDDLGPGEIRELTDEQIVSLYKAAGLEYP